MCLGIPGEIVELIADQPDLAMVNVNGQSRPINIGLLEPGEAMPGNWVLIHLGFAVSPLEEEEGRAYLSFPQNLADLAPPETDQRAG